MSWILDVLALLGAKGAKACSPVWKAWDWLTGRRTLDLAWILYGIAAVSDAGLYLRHHDGLGLAIVVIYALIVGFDLLALSSYVPSGDAVPMAVAMSRRGLLAISGISLVFLPSDLVSIARHGVVTHPFVNIIWMFATLAGGVNLPGGGRSCLDRAADVIGSFGFRPATGAA